MLSIGIHKRSAGARSGAWVHEKGTKARVILYPHSQTLCGVQRESRFV